MNRIALPILVAVALATSACTPEAPVAPKATPTGVTAPASPPAVAGASDPSVPPATAAVGAQTVPPSETANDSPSTRPMSTLTKEEEKTAMPMAAQGNNHSSPSLETRAPGK